MTAARLNPRGDPSPRVPERSRSGVPGIAAWAIAIGLALAGCGSHASSPNSSTQSSATSRANSTSALITAGIAQADARQFQQAQTTFHDVLVLDPSNKFALYNLGLIAQVQNHPSAALASYTRAVAIDPTYTPAMYNKAILLEGTDAHSALSLYQRITSINPKAATAYLRESFVYDRLGDKAKAAQARARAIALDKRLATVTAAAPSGK